MDDLRQSPNYARYMEKIGWKVERVDGCQIFIKKLPLVGSIIKIQRPRKIPFEKIDNLAKKYRALFVKIEPTRLDDRSGMMDHGYKPNSSSMLPTKTLQIDLNQSEEKIFSQMKKDARYEIKKAEKNKLNLLISHYPSVLISDFISLWHQNAWVRGFWIPIKKQVRALWESFGKDAYLVTTHCYNDTYHHSEILAGALILVYNSVASYFHAASTPLGRKLSAPYLIVWEAIKLAKENGCQIFDFEGIYDERFPIKSWQGFTHFKKSFGGKEAEYPGTFVKYRLPF